MDSSVLYGWRHRNYIFDSNLNRYILQHRTVSSKDTNPIPRGVGPNQSCIDPPPTPITNNNEYIMLTQHNIMSIVSNWYRVFYQLKKPSSLSTKRTNRLIISTLMAYSLQRFEFDEHHRLIQTSVHYDIDDDSSVGSSESTTSSNDDSLSISNDPSVSIECTASLPVIKWSTVFFGGLLDSSLHKEVFVCNVKVDKLGYGVGFAIFGHKSDDNTLFYDDNKLNDLIQYEYNGYPDNMNHCFTIYDDGQYSDWNTQSDADKSNVNDIPSDYTKNTVKLISKLSKFRLKTSKTSLSPSLTKITSSNCEEKRSNPLQKRLYKKSVSDKNVLKKRSFYGQRQRSKPKKISEKFSFDEKSDVIQICVDLYHKKISIHNLNNHRCVIVKDFDYDVFRLAFVLRYSNISVIDQKWI